MLTDTAKKAIRIGRQGAYGTQDFIDLCVSKETFASMTEEQRSAVIRLANLAMRLASTGNFNLRNV